MQFKVTGTIDDPWDAGEAMGWPKLVGVLACSESNAAGTLELDQQLSWKGLSADRFHVTPRHANQDWLSVEGPDGLHCNAWAASDEALRFIFTLKASTAFP